MHLGIKHKLIKSHRTFQIHFELGIVKKFDKSSSESRLFLIKNYYCYGIVREIYETAVENL